MALLLACRPGDVHSVLPVLASTPKYWPAFLFVMPNSMSPIKTILVRRSGMSAFSQTFVVVHVAPFLEAVNATVGPPLPDTMMVWPYRMGVFEFVDTWLG